MTALLAGCLWVFVATGTALLPMRHQMAPGLVLLASAPVIVVWMSLVLGWWVGLLAVLAFLSMFRRPLAALLRWAFRRGART
jgi:hypothetical protein